MLTATKKDELVQYALHMSHIGTVYRVTNFGCGTGANIRGEWIEAQILLAMVIQK